MSEIKETDSCREMNKMAKLLAESKENRKNRETSSVYVIGKFCLHVHNTKEQKRQ